MASQIWARLAIPRELKYFKLRCWQVVSSGSRRLICGLCNQVSPKEMEEVVGGRRCGNMYKDFELVKVWRL